MVDVSVLLQTTAPLTSLLKSLKESRSRLARWIVALSEYDWDIQHKPGRENTNADSLSRIPQRHGQEESKHESEDVRIEDLSTFCAAIEILPCYSKEELRKDQESNPTLQFVLPQMSHESPQLSGVWKTDTKLHRFWEVWMQLKLVDGVLYRAKRVRSSPDATMLLVLPQSLIPSSVEYLHNDLGHFGIDKTIALTEEGFWWPGYVSDVQHWVQSCNTCARTKPPHRSPRAPLQSIPVGGPMEALAIDFVGPLPESDRGNRHILVLTDYYTKWAEAFALKIQKADTVARV